MINIDGTGLTNLTTNPADDTNDPATSICEPPPTRDYRPFLNAGALQGARNGIPRAWIKKVRRAMTTLVPQFNTWRMVQDYTTKYYLAK